MKKFNKLFGIIISVVLIIVITMVFAACNDNDDSTNSSGNNGGGNNPPSGGNPLTEPPSSSVTLTVSNTSEWNNALTTIKNGGNSKNYTITVSGDIQVPGSTEASISFGNVNNVTVTFKGNGKLYLVGLGSILNISYGQTVYINSSGLTFEGLKKEQNDSTLDNLYPIIYSNGGILELRNGTIKNNNSGNYSIIPGGGVAVINGTFTMSGGEISGNTITDSDGDGGGLFANGTNVTITGGKINGNTATGGGGGGVYLERGTFTMSGGEINNNTSTYGGGGLYGLFISFTMTGGIINGNSSNFIGGGGVVISITSNSTMSGGVISGNTTTQGSGGGMNIITVAGTFDVTFTMSGGEIRGNTVNNSFGSGGGIDGIGIFNKTGGGIIYGNNTGNNSNTANSEKGHAVSWGNLDSRLYRNITLGANDNITSNTLTGWE